MHRAEFEKNWNQWKGKILAKWNRFTHEDLDKVHGNYEQFVAMFQKKYGWAREQVEKELKHCYDQWCQNKDSSHSCSECNCSRKPGFWKKEGKKPEDRPEKKRKAG